MPDIDLPPVPVPLPDDGGAPTRAAQDDSTLKRTRLAPAPAAIAAPAVATPAPPAAPRLPMQSRMRSRLLAVLGGAVVLLVGVAGIWLVMSHNANSGVEALIATKKYPEALAAIKAANPLILTSANALKDQLEAAWLAELYEPAGDDTPETLKQSLQELDRFLAAFANHDHARAHRAEMQQRLQDNVSSAINDYLARGQPDAAQELLSRYRALLADHDKLQARIEAKGDAAHAVVTPKVAATADPKAADAALAAAWQAALADPLVLDGARQALAQAQAQLGKQPHPSPQQERNCHAIAALLRGHGEPRDAGRKAVAELVALLRDGDATLGQRLWPALVRLDRQKELLDFDNLGLPAPPGAAQQAGRQLYAQVLERQLRRDDFAWLPSASERDQINAWAHSASALPTAS